MANRFRGLVSRRWNLLKPCINGQTTGNEALRFAVGAPRRSPDPQASVAALGQGSDSGIMTSS